MLKSLKIIPAVLVIIALVGYHVYTVTKLQAAVTTANVAVQDMMDKAKEQEEADAKLGQYIINMMYMSNKTVDALSPARMQVLARSIVRVANDIFDNADNKRDLVMAIQIESEFLKYAQSPTGPKGLTQVAKATFHEALADCGVLKAKDDDVWETDLNLYAGACYFKKQLIKFNGDARLAIVAYNQGANSKSAKTYSKSGHMNELEPLKYIAKFVFLEKNVSDEKKPGVPAFKDLPKPVAPTKEQ